MTPQYAVVVPVERWKEFRGHAPTRLGGTRQEWKQTADGLLKERKKEPRGGFPPLVRRRARRFSGKVLLNVVEHPVEIGIGGAFLLDLLHRVHHRRVMFVVELLADLGK